MTAHTLPIPNAHDWATRYAAADALGVDERTIDRLADAGTLTPYHPRGRKGTRVAVMFWWPEVQEVARARNRLRPS